MKNIVLIGFMGTGKSTIGRELSRRTSWKFLDMDQLIEKEQGRTIPEIFAAEGEEYFRQLERDLVKRLSAKSRLIISTGGGTAKNPDNVADFKKKGVVICLYADVDDIYARTSRRGRRPVLDQYEDRRQAIVELLAQRQPMYDQADYKVCTSNTNMNDVCNEIIRLAKR